MLPARRDLALYRRDRYSHTLTFTHLGDPLELEGEWQAQIREYPAAPGTLAAFTIDASQAAAGILILGLDRDVVALLPDVCCWDLENTTDEQTYLQGEICVTEDVTR